MSARDGVNDADYDVLRKAGLSREQCWAVLDCQRDPQEDPPPNAAKDKANKKQSGVRV